jgi:multiple sugar transport system substrate-binding protein
MAMTIVSCRSDQSGQVHDAAKAATTAPITLTLSGWQSNPNEEKALKQALKNFEAANPIIKVKYEVINSQYMDVIKTRLIGEVAPDVFYLDAFEAPLLMKYKVVEPLNNYISSDYQLADFEPTLLQAFTAQNQLYGIPKDFSTLALLYNKKAFAAAGLTTPPKTWAELQTYARKLTIDRNQDGRIDQYGFGIAPEMARQVFMIEAFGGQVVNQYGYAAFATPQGLQGLALLIDQYRRDRTAAQPTDTGASSSSEMFGQGKAAMVLEGPWAIPYLQETFPDLEFATAEVPTINNKQSTMAYTVAYVMNRNTRHKTAAWKLIAFLTSAQGMKAASTQGLALPTRRSVLQELGYKNKPSYTPFVTGASYATIWQAGENLPIILTNFDNQFISALLGEQSLETAMQKAQETANREIYLSN